MVQLQPMTFRESKQAALARFERVYFDDLNRATGGNISEMARRADMQRAHVRFYLDKHGLRPSRAALLPPAQAPLEAS